MDEREIMSIYDDDGVEHNMEVLEVTQLCGNTYVALRPLTDDCLEPDDEDGCPLTILKVIDEETLENIVDDEEFEAVSKVFFTMLEDDYEILSDD